VKAYLDEYRQAIVEIVLKGKRTDIGTKAIIDTGFDGDICLPIYLAIQLGLELKSVQTVELADGSKKNELVFAGSIKFDKSEQEIEIFLTNAKDTLLGTGLLYDKILKIDFVKGDVEITRGY